MSTTKGPRYLAWSAVAALLVAACKVPAGAAEGSVVVLPFRNETKRKDVDFWRVGFQELLIQTLAERGVPVARRDAVAKAWTPPGTGTLDPQKELGRLRDLLPAAVVVTGVFRNGAENVELVVEAWNEQRQSRVSAVHQVSGEDALFDAAELQASALAEVPLPLSIRGRESARPAPEAFRDFVAGEDGSSKPGAERQRAIAALESAIARAPDWALPYPYLLAAYLETGDRPNARRLLALARSRQAALPTLERQWLESLARRLALEP